MSNLANLSTEIFNKYNINGPRYTSYPTALEFHDQFGDPEFDVAVSQSTNQALSLYLHIPFCHSLCYYCGCNKVVTRHKEKADIYLDHLIAEIKHKAESFQHHKVQQLHLGGGTPSFLSKAQMTRLIDEIKSRFHFDTVVEMGIEIDPREIELDYIDHLASLGFNRLSIGVQDINEEVQVAINRVQDTDFVVDLIQRAKSLQFESINIDLIYGLPHQDKNSFNATLHAALVMDPDRISLFSYAHLPSRFAAQRKIKDEWLPQGQQKMALMFDAINFLTEHGYVAIGMDHFAKPDDELAIAQQAGKLHRNFQGYTTKGDCDLLGLGVSAISSVGRSFSQNVKELKHYYQAIETRQSALEKGLMLSEDDVIRGYVIKHLMCNFELNKRDVEAQFNINFDQYFAEDLSKLDVFVNDKLVDIDSESIQVRPIAKLLIRNIAMSFDAYMANQLNKQRFSRVI